MKTKRSGFCVAVKGGALDPVAGVRPDTATGDMQVLGYASVFGNLDAGGDVVVRGAFARSLERTPNVPLFYGHQHNTVPVGRTVRLVEAEDGLLMRAVITRTRLGEDVIKALALGSVSGLSIGYNVVRSRRGRQGGQSVRFLTELELMEISVVAFPMNAEARISEADADTLKDMLLVACTEDARRKGVPLHKRELADYAAAQARLCERIAYGGRTWPAYRAALLNRVAREMRELRALAVQ